MLLYSKIKSDLLMLGLPTDFKLHIKGYSKCYNGRYDPNDGTVIVFAEHEDGRRLDYDTIIQTVIHEGIHHYQWKHDTNFKRVKGVMHDPKFKELENHYLNLALNKGVLKKCY